MKLLKRQDQQPETGLAERQNETDPWKQMWSLKDAMDRMFTDRFWAPFGGLSRMEQEWETLSPRVDLQEKNDQLILKADVPGVDDDKLNVEVTENMVCLSGRIEREEEKEEENVYRREREEGEFRRDVMLPAKVDPNSVQATLRNGLLTVTLNKQKGEERKKIDIKKG